MRLFFALFLLALAVATPAQAELGPPAVATAAAQPPGKPQAVALVVAALGLVGFALRRFTPFEHWFHTSAAAGISAGVAFVLGAVAQIVASSGFNGWAIATGAIGAASMALGMANPSLPAADKAGVLK